MKIYHNKEHVQVHMKSKLHTSYSFKYPKLNHSQGDPKIDRATRPFLEIDMRH